MEVLAVFLRHPAINLEMPCRNGITLLEKTIIHFVQTALIKKQNDANIRDVTAWLYNTHTEEVMEQYNQSIQCLNYLIFSGAQVNHETIEKACQMHFSEFQKQGFQSDFYPEIKSLIDNTLKTKSGIEEKLRHYPSEVIKHCLFIAGR